MSLSSKVFIYNREGASEKSADDLKELFTSEKIFKNRPDVILSDFQFNPSDLKMPTLVIPGGSATKIGCTVAPQINKIRAHLSNDFNYVGVCAGAFIGTMPADLFLTSHTFMPLTKDFEAPKFLWKTDAFKVNLDFISDYKAVGSFYPHAGHQQSSAKAYMPYRVNLSLVENKEQLAQLYVAGPGFCQLENKGQTSVVATYADSEIYTFCYENEIQQMKEFPAMICSKPTEKKGGVFLSGTHIEACVANSKFLTFFKSGGQHNGALKDDEYNAFIAEQEKTRSTIESLLSQTLK